MADHHSSDTETISTHMDYAQHEATWKIFGRLIKWGVIGCAVLAVALYFFIRP
jgi:hypothetical protein